MSDHPPKPPSRPAPAFGALDGVRKDVKSAKEGGYDPRGVGVAWTHDFLNKKPWHPMNFRNRVRVWEAEQEHIESEQRKERGRQEFEAEQELLKTISMLSPEEQERYRQRQSVSWLYQKPPGYDAAQAQPKDPAQDQKEEGGSVQHPATGAGPQPGTSLVPSGAAAEGNTKQGRHTKCGNYLAKVVGGVQAVFQSQMFELKNSGLGLSPPRGGAVDPLAENQKLVVGEMDSDEEEEIYRLAMMSEEEKLRLEKEAARERRRRRKAERAQRLTEEKNKLEEAKEFLRAAGIAVPESSGSSDSDNTSDSEDSGVAEEVEGRSKKRRHVEKRRKESRRSKKKR